MQILAQIEPRLWSDLGRRVERIAYPPGAHFAREPLEEALRDTLDDYEAFRGDATLAAVDETRFHRCGRGPLEISVLEHDERIAAAELEHRLLQVSTCLLRHLAPRAVRAGERHRAHSLVGDDAAGGIVREEHRPEQTIREAGVLEDGFDLEGTARHVGSVFQDAGVPGDQGRCSEAKHLPEREIPWHDGEHRT